MSSIGYRLRVSQLVEGFSQPRATSGTFPHLILSKNSQPNPYSNLHCLIHLLLDSSIVFYGHWYLEVSVKTCVLSNLLTWLNIIASWRFSTPSNTKIQWDNSTKWSTQILPAQTYADPIEYVEICLCLHPSSKSSRCVNQSLAIIYLMDFCHLSLTLHRKDRLYWIWQLVLPVACIWYSNIPRHRFKASLVFLPHHLSTHSLCLDHRLFSPPINILPSTISTPNHLSQTLFLDMT